MLISIVTATYNSERFISQMIASLNAQSYRDFEHIIIDGCSADNTVKILTSQCFHDPVILVEKDTGIYDALNKGISLASGEYVIFLHSDDIFASDDTLAEIIVDLRENDPDILYGDVDFVSHSDPNLVVRSWVAGDFKRCNLRFGWMPPHPSFIARRYLYKNFGVFDTSLKISADYENMLRLLLNPSLSVKYANRKFTIMRTGGISTRLSNMFMKFSEDYYVANTFFRFPLIVIVLKVIRKLRQLGRFNRL